MRALLCVAIALPALLAAALPARGQTAEPRWDFRCPPRGVVVERSQGLGRLTFQGAAAASPQVCASGSGMLLLGLWRLDQPSAQAAVEPLRTLFPARAGSQIRVLYSRNTAERDTFQIYEDVWRVLGRQRIEVPAGSFEAIAFERETASLGTSRRRFRRLVRFWLEAETGAPLQLEHVWLGGSMDTNVQSWQATLLRLPGAHPPR